MRAGDTVDVHQRGRRARSQGLEHGDVAVDLEQLPGIEEDVWSYVRRPVHRDVEGAGLLREQGEVGVRDGLALGHESLVAEWVRDVRPLIAPQPGIQVDAPEIARACVLAAYRVREDDVALRLQGSRQPRFKREANRKRRGPAVADEDLAAQVLLELGPVAEDPVLHVDCGVLGAQRRQEDRHQHDHDGGRDAGLPEIPTGVRAELEAAAERGQERSAVAVPEQQRERDE